MLPQFDGYMTRIINELRHKFYLNVLVMLLCECFLLVGCVNRDDTARLSVDRVQDKSVEDVVRNPLRNAYFGDTHVHSRYSFDSSLFGVLATPDEAYRFAKGSPLKHASGQAMILNQPLDFFSITDHAGLLGGVISFAEMDPQNGNEIVSFAKKVSRCWEVGCDRSPISSPSWSVNAWDAVRDFFRGLRASQADRGVLNNQRIVGDSWEKIIQAAEHHNDPNKFTTFIGYEYTALSPTNGNLHRNVLFRSSVAPELPFSMFDSANPEDLWDWMDSLRDAGIDSLAIPHNSNGSDGWMFQMAQYDGSPQDVEYAEQRMRNEPIVENTQIKGTSDTHPLLSPNDDWANFEVMPYLVGREGVSEIRGSYLRHALGRGLKQEAEMGFNPFKFGFIGSSDSHNGGGSYHEDDFMGKVGVVDASAKSRGSIPIRDADEWESLKTRLFDLGPEVKAASDGRMYSNTAFKTWSASGLAGIWAESNTRSDLFDAMRRKEVFSTTGPRIKIRFFGSFKFADDFLEREDAIAKAYMEGVPMGGTMNRDGQVPSFLVWSTADPNSSMLQRLQVIKGWIDSGDFREKVFDVACSSGQMPDPSSGRCPDYDFSVDLKSCATSGDSGATELKTLWRDPEFDVSHRAFYYVRALEEPKCRWSTWDAIRANVKPRVDIPATIQDRAWSSPIWYEP